MSFFRELFKGIGNCFKGLALVFEKGLWHYLLYPLVLYVLMWIVGVYTFSGLASAMSQEFIGWLHLEDLPDSGTLMSFVKPFLVSSFSFIFTWALKLIFMFIAGTFFKYILLMVLSPLFALLSEAIEHNIKGSTYPFSFRQLLKDIFRGVCISFRNMLLEYLFIAACFLINILFPPSLLVTMPFLLFVSWYYFGFTMLDYNFERHRMSVRQSVKFARSHLGLACGIGMVYAFFMSLPTFLGSLVGITFGPVMAVAGAAVSFLDIKDQQSPTT